MTGEAERKQSGPGRAGGACWRSLAALMLLGKGGGVLGRRKSKKPKCRSNRAKRWPSSRRNAPTGMGELPDLGAAGEAAAAAPSPPPTTPSKTVALLVVHDGGIDDKYTKQALKEVGRRSKASTVIVVPAKQISRYASVTVGLNISQLPALIVMRPKSLSHGVPQATVAYGYQTVAEHRPDDPRRRLQGPRRQRPTTPDERRGAPTTRPICSRSPTSTAPPRPPPDPAPSPSRRGPRA